jgi:hypothetical protein
VFKGASRDTVKISTALSSAECGAAFSKGGLFLVYSDQDGDLLTTGLCHANQSAHTKAGLEEIDRARKISMRQRKEAEP